MLILRLIVYVCLSSIFFVVIGSTENNSSCRRSHFKSSTGECLPCIDGCFRCENNETCTVCETKYTRTNIGKCQLCQKNCNSCDLNECIACSNGYFLQNKSCVSCPFTCHECTSHDSCTECTSGSWGHQCDKTCPYNCSKDICNIATGNCDACDEGYFGINCSKCPENCWNNLCNMSGHCTDGCLAGFYGERCTQPCRNTCKYCWNESICYKCLEGYYGPRCELTCSKCKHNTCNKFACKYGCKIGFYLDGIECKRCSKNCEACKSSDQCNRCLDGSYGPVCEFNCSTCKDSVCNGTECTKGCKTGFYLDGIECKRCSTNCRACTSSDMCSHCQDSYYGQVCEFNCSYCQYSACDKLSCLYGCKQGFYMNETECKICRANCKACYSSDMCTQCQEGYYGPVCEFNCSYCQNSSCDKSSCLYGCKQGFYLDRIECKSCRANCKACYSIDNCSQCLDGYYGPVCEFNCSKCKYGNCNKLSCVFGCKAGFHWDGTECKHCPTNCKACNSSERCSECEDGKYGQICHQDCNEYKCLACEGNESKCTKCYTGYKLEGNRCCSVNCQTCDDDGQCETCPDGFYGVNCTESFPIEGRPSDEGPDVILVAVVITLSVVLLGFILSVILLIRKRTSTQESNQRTRDRPDVGEIGNPTEYEELTERPRQDATYTALNVDHNASRVPAERLFQDGAYIDLNTGTVLAQTSGSQYEDLTHGQGLESDYKGLNLNEVLSQQEKLEIQIEESSDVGEYIDME